MSIPLYHEYDEKYLNKNTLIKDNDFIDDASAFLIDREGYRAEELDTQSKVYDAYMEHFRVQNVNEVTALKDMNYAQETDDEGRSRMGRLMDTYDRMDSDFGLDAAGDYLEGVLTAPSTYAGIFTGGAAKAGQLAAQQGVKFGIRQAIKKGGLRGLGVAAAVEVPTAMGTVAAQEQTRVETGIKEDIDLSNVGLAGATALLVGGTIGLATGTHTALRSFQAEELVRASTKDDKAIVEAGHTLSKKVFKVGKDASKTDKAKAETANKILKSITADKLALVDTIPEELAAGKALRQRLAEQTGDKDILPDIDSKLLQNIAAAGARVYHLIPPRKVEGKELIAGSAEDLQERFTSRVVRGIREGYVPKEEIKKILDDHGVTSQQLGVVMGNNAAEVLAERVSTSAKIMRGQRTAKELAKEIQLELNEIDDALLNMGDFTSIGRKRLKELADKNNLGIDVGGAIENMNKGRVGLMTIQIATTVRNTTNGFMRNYVYALDNAGMGLVNITKGKIKKAFNPSDAQVRKFAEEDVALGKAQMRTAFDSFMLKDLVLGMNSASTTALTRLMKDDRFGNSGITKQLFRDMGDVAQQTGAEGGLLGLARRLNTLNTMSDNMFKRAVFSRELNKQILASSGGKKDLATVLKEGNFAQIKSESFADAMETALDFTYQTGGFARKEGGFNTFSDAFIKFGQSTGGSLAIPFPRYMVNQFRFMYEHMPVMGLLDIGGVLNKSEVPDRIAKQMTGLTMLGTFMAIRSQFGDENTGPYEYLDPTSRGSFDMKASLGPFTAFAMIADFLYRTNPDLLGIGKLHDNDRVAKDIPYSVQEFINALTGGQGRAGTQVDFIDSITDVAINGLEDGLSKDMVFEKVAKFAGNTLNTTTVGAGVLKDLVASVDPSFRQVPNNDDVSLLGYMLKTATRSFPESEESADFVKQESPTRAGGLRMVNPFIKQLTGLTPRAEKNTVEKEFERLGLKYYEFAPQNIKLDRPLTNEARGLMGRYMEGEGARYILGDGYNDLGNDKLKRAKLKEYMGKVKSQARDLALDPYRMNTGPTEAETNRRRKVLYYNKVSPSDRLIIEGSYEKEHGSTIAEDESWTEALKLADRLAEGRK
jgi:hypothetical protein